MRREIARTGIFLGVSLFIFGMPAGAAETEKEESTPVKVQAQTTSTSADAKKQEEEQHIEVMPITEKRLEVSKIERKGRKTEQESSDVVSIQRPKTGRRSGEIKENAQSDRVVFTAPLDGWYQIELTDMRVDMAVSFSVCDMEGEVLQEEIDGTNGKSLTVELKAGESYSICVEQKKGVGTYQLMIGYQKKTVDISGYTEISDCMEYKNQCNSYTFLAQSSGRYRLEMSEMEEKEVLSLTVYDQQGQEIFQEDEIKNGEGIVLDGIRAEESYTVLVTQKQGLGSYQMKIGMQKEMVDLSKAADVKDRMEFTDQINRYSFIASEDGEYRFTLEDMPDGAKVNMTIFDPSGMIAATGSLLEQESYLSLKNVEAGDLYEIQIQQEEDFPVYQLSIQREVPGELFCTWMTDTIESGEIETFWEEAENYKELIQKSEEMNEMISRLEAYLNAEVIYEFGPHYEELGQDTIRTWITFDPENFVLDLDEAGIYDYVAQFAATYDTYNKARYFQTYDGSYVTVYGGSGYGWMIDQYSEVISLQDWISQGQTGTKSPIFAQQAASWDNCDLGYDYVEVDLTYQYVCMYIGGVRIVESPCVSGDLTLTDRTTPSGTYTLYYKQSPATLIGEDYVQPVEYWMPFNGGIGLHDATWRGAFGGDIYVSNGSHGCINLPLYAAQVIYENIYAGMPVICYYRW